VKSGCEKLDTPRTWSSNDCKTVTFGSGVSDARSSTLKHGVPKIGRPVLSEEESRMLDAQHYRTYAKI
jgi:hypothetical protein